MLNRPIVFMCFLQVACVRANADDPKHVWNNAPINTRAVVVVSEMDAFSDKIDHVADLMNLQQPGVLQFAKRQSGIRVGLDEAGPLMWFYGPKLEGDSKLIYLLPATNGKQLLASLNARSDLEERRVTIDREEYIADEVQTFVGFTDPTPASRSWLRDCRDNGGGGAEAFGALNSYMDTQDITYAITPQGLREGVDIELPFSKGDYVFPEIVKGLSNQFSLVKQFSAIGGGVRVDPDSGMVFSLATLIRATSHVSRWSDTMSMDRDQLLANIPDGEIALVFATAFPQQWKVEVESIIHEFLSEHHPKAEALNKMLDLSRLQGLTLVVQSQQPDQTWGSTIQLQIHCEEPVKAIDAFHQWTNTLLADGDKQLVLKDQRIGKQLVLSMNLNELHVPVTLAMSVLNENSLLISGGGVAQLEKELKARVQPRRLMDSEELRDICTLSNSKTQMMTLLNVERSARWAINFSRDITDSLTPFEPLILNYAAMFKNVPPVFLETKFGPGTSETSVIIGNGLMNSIGEVVHSFYPSLKASNK